MYTYVVKFNKIGTHVTFLQKQNSKNDLQNHNDNLFNIHDNLFNNSVQ